MPPETTPTGSTSSMTGLLPFLRHARQQLLHLPASRAAGASSSSSSVSLSQTPVLVLGNQSADLDSINSAIVYSYFFSRASRNSKNRRLHVPVINLPDVPSGPELRRLRPEFACALELTTATTSSSNLRSEKASSSGKDVNTVQLLKEHILTVADLRAQLQSGSGTETGKLELDAVLVDWNKPSHHEEGKIGKGSVDGLHDLATLSVTGCIDHHADEGFVPAAEALPEGSLRVIELGPGSCTSVIIREVQRCGLWSSSSVASLPRGTTEDQSPSNIDADDVDVQIAKLALAAILIDTGNLTAEGKVTDVDREAVSFLSQKILDAAGSGSFGDPWNAKKFFEEIQHAKAHSLDWLTVHEALGRDYKDWTESTGSPSTNKITIGIASVVRPLSWLISKANDEEGEEEKGGGGGLQNQRDLDTMLAKLKDFAQQKRLDVVSVMTAFTSGEDDRFQRELLVWGLHDECTAQLETFFESTKEELHLEQWDQFPFEGKAAGASRLYIWRQGSVRCSRKQVAPLLRKVYSGSRSTHI